MMTPEKVRHNLEILVREGEAVKATKQRGDFEDYVDTEISREWSTSVVALIRSIFGDKSDHYAMAIKHAEVVYNWSGTIQLFGVLRSALKAWDNGYVFELRQLAEADVEASLIDQAEELLDKGYHQAATVLAGAVLEQHLRSICAKYGIAEHTPAGKPKTLDPLNNELCGAGAYDKIQQKKVTYLAGIRNDAAHGNPVTVDNAKELVRSAIDLCAKLR